MNPAGHDLGRGLVIRIACAAEVPTLERLIAASARALSRGFYNSREIDAVVTHVFGIDSDLIRDGTYLVAEQDGAAVGCGGWSRRRTLFGGDRFIGRDAGLLDPGSEAARIRAFFVGPGFERNGVASRLLAAAETAAAANGFTRAALMATLPGVPFYEARGYRALPPIDHLSGDVPVRFVPMKKELLQK